MNRLTYFRKKNHIITSLKDCIEDRIVRHSSIIDSGVEIVVTASEEPGRGENRFASCLDLTN